VRLIERSRSKQPAEDEVGTCKCTIQPRTPETRFIKHTTHLASFRSFFKCLSVKERRREEIDETTKQARTAHSGSYYSWQEEFQELVPASTLLLQVHKDMEYDVRPSHTKSRSRCQSKYGRLCVRDSHPEYCQFF